MCLLVQRTSKHSSVIPNEVLVTMRICSVKNISQSFAEVIANELFKLGCTNSGAVKKFAHKKKRMLSTRIWVIINVCVLSGRLLCCMWAPLDPSFLLKDVTEYILYLTLTQI